MQPIPARLALLRSSHPGASWPLGFCVILFVIASLLVHPRSALPDNHLPKLPDCPPERDLCLQAERKGGVDLKTGVAFLEGKVVGLMRSRDLAFQGESLRAFRDGGDTWVRLILKKNVRLFQSDQQSRSDWALLKEKLIHLSGNVSIRQEEWSVEAQKAILDGERDLIRLTSLPDIPLKIVFRQLLLDPSHAIRKEEVAQEKTVRESIPVSTHIQANTAVISRLDGKFILSGEVTIEQSDGSLEIRGNRVIMDFHPDHSLKRFQADGNVFIHQPDRTITADHAFTREGLGTIVLTGNATLRQRDTFDLQAEQLEVYTDASKGIIRSQDEEKPITLSLDLGKSTPFLLTTEGLTQLGSGTIPLLTAGKLSSLIGQEFPSRAAFRQGVAALLTPEESERHFDAIAAAAR